MRSIADREVEPVADAPPCSRHIAVIDEARCIGCARCLDPCPVDAIVGAQKFLHTVIEELCIGCGFCVVPCPVDCIELRESSDALVRPALEPDRVEDRFRAHLERLARRRRRAGASLENPSRRRRQVIAAAIERSRARRRERGPA